jgi:hypothetical protein
MRYVILTLGVLLTGVPVALASQSTVTASPGSRVRVSVEEGIPPATKKRIIGTLVSVNDESVILQSTNDNGQQSFPAASVRTLEVSMGRRSTEWEVGLLGGLALGTANAIGAYNKESNCIPHTRGWEVTTCGSPTGMSVIGFVAGGVLGAAVGSVIGARLHTDRWVRVPHDVRGAVRPAAGGVAITFSVVR